jgi:hypothetical protein
MAKRMGLFVRPCASLVDLGAHLSANLLLNSSEALLDRSIDARLTLGLGIDICGLVGNGLRRAFLRLRP